MKIDNMLHRLMFILSFSLLALVFPNEIHAQQDTIELYHDENFLGNKQLLQWMNANVLYIGWNAEDNIQGDSNKVFVDSLNPYSGKYDVYWHCRDAPNPRMWMILYDSNYPSSHNPVDATGTDKVTFWVKADSSTKPFWFWTEDASYAGQQGQSAHIAISGESVYADSQVVKYVPFNGQWQFVSLPWSLLKSNDTAYVSRTFYGSMAYPATNMDISILRDVQFDSNVWTVVKRPPIGQGYKSDYYVDDVYFVKSTVTGINGEQINVPALFNLYQNYPNPFNPSTNIKYDLPTYATVTLKIYNLLGQEVRTLVNNQFQNPGMYSILWDGRDDHGSSLPSGQYAYRLQASHYTSTRKMILLK